MGYGISMAYLWYIYGISMVCYGMLWYIMVCYSILWYIMVGYGILWYSIMAQHRRPGDGGFGALGV